MKFENTEVFNFKGAFRGMRNPKESWGKSDSGYYEYRPENNEWVKRIGKNDLKLAQTLIKAGSEHRKFLRQIFVSVDRTAPLYWWKEFDTYKVGTVANSTSTMFRLASTPITRECFEMDDALVLHNHLAKVRKEKGLSQADLAKMVGVSRNTISSIETGQYSPTAKLALILCIALDTKFEDLFFF